MLKAEAKHVYQLYLNGHIREIYFTQDKDAVLILECKDIPTAKNLLNLLPLVSGGLIEFDVFELRPYTGWNRIIKAD